MNIQPIQIKVADLVAGYTDEGENGVVGYGGKLDIRPAYQREFVYNDRQRDAVIDTVMRGYPLNVMYWAKRADGSFEVLDGQQRTLSLCKYFNREFAFDMRYFHNLADDEKAKFLDYGLSIYVCDGSASEKLGWFRTINIAGEKLTDQELRNAVYAGPWTTDAKRYFSRSACPAKSVGGDYVSGAFDRQEVLETAIRWLCAGEPEGYMALHQNDASASPLWLHFQNVINWVQTVFPHYRAKMKGLDWGRLFREYGPATGRTYNPASLENRIAELWRDDEVDKKSGIFEFLLSGEAPEKRKLLSLRTFTDSQKEAAYEKQGGKCAVCGKPFPLAEMQGDHIVPWSKGGKTVPENLQMLCARCNHEKGGALL
ncbi:MAG: DUF262 domain-containing protein [Kiritimatiellae bacterium]|nr:DUF262 domain-containing protein [Kiritimatiellia bacterium]